MALKTYSKLPVHVEEFHNDVLQHIYKAIGGKYLPLQDITMIHFDSHPDLGIPEELTSREVFQKSKLLSLISIENWIMPAAFAGHINKIIWVRAPWCDQLPCGVHKFCIGEDCDGLIRVSLQVEYFVDDCCYRNEEDLTKKRLVELHVIDISANPELLARSLSCDEKFILDIDLDYYSTRNPFIAMFSDHDLKQLTQLYSSESEIKKSDPIQFQNLRKKQLANLQESLKLLFNGKEPSVKDSDFLKLESIVANYRMRSKENEEDEDFEILHGAGCASGDPPLPHHISSEEEIGQMIDQTVKSLKYLSKPPTIITLCRSSVDDYCPSDQVDFIQNHLIESLQELYAPLSILRHYDE